MAKRAKPENVKGAGDIGEIGAPEQQQTEKVYEFDSDQFKALLTEALQPFVERIAALEAEVKTLKGV